MSKALESKNKYLTKKAELTNSPLCDHFLFGNHSLFFDDFGVLIHESKNFFRRTEVNPPNNDR